MTECLFCKIARRELDSDIVHESDDIMVFRDINPAAPLHVLAIPKEHMASVDELNRNHAGVLAEMLIALSTIADREGTDGGYRIVTNVGPDAGQSVLHLHFHLLGGRTMEWPPG
ncbi:MAG: histidine triad nucleotide-binding protein [Actinomycetota bacterium]